MSGPITRDDADETEAAPEPVEAPTVELVPSHEATVGAMSVRRALPRRGRRTVGAWCFADHMGPTAVTEDRGVDIGPHPHIGLHTVTWLTAGEIFHRDSLGSEQVIRPGQLNLMRAGNGVSHSEEATGSYRGDLHGVQLWLAQPDATRRGEPAFAHHAELPRLDLATALATVVVGSLAGTRSPADVDSESVGAELVLRGGRCVIPVDFGHEHAVVVLDGAVSIDGHLVRPGVLAYLGEHRDELVIDAEEPATILLIGGLPFPERLLMWWNFVARSRDEVTDAYRDWNEGDPRFGQVDSPLERIPAQAPHWMGGA